MKTQLLFLLLVGCSTLAAQSYRAQWKEGVEAYNQKQYEQAEARFNQALEAGDPASPNWLNLGNSYFRQERYDEALKAYRKMEEQAPSPQLKSKAQHNCGNTLWEQQKLPEAINAYRQALISDPSNQAARYNLAQALRKQKQQQQNKNQDKDDKNNQDQQKDGQNKDQQKNDQQKDNKDGKKQEEEKDRNQQQKQENQSQQGQDKNQEDQKQNGKPRQLPKDVAEQLLKALAREEQKVQDKVRKNKEKVVVIPTEKDW